MMTCRLEVLVFGPCGPGTLTGPFRAATGIAALSKDRLSGLKLLQLATDILPGLGAARSRAKVVPAKRKVAGSKDKLARTPRLALEIQTVAGSIGNQNVGALGVELNTRHSSHAGIPHSLPHMKTGQGRQISLEPVETILSSNGLGGFKALVVAKDDFRHCGFVVEVESVFLCSILRIETEHTKA